MIGPALINPSLRPQGVAELLSDLRAALLGAEAFYLRVILERHTSAPVGSVS